MKEMFIREPKIAKNCEYCKEVFMSFKCQNRKFCCWYCYINSMKGREMPKSVYEKSSGFKGKHHSNETKEKIRESLIEYEFTPEHIKNLKIARRNQIRPLQDTTIEVKLQNFLTQLNIEFYTHYWMNIKHNYQCDIFIPSMNLIIECFGDYWHKIPYGNPVDSLRCQELRKKGFKVLIFWEREIRAMKLNDFKQELLEETKWNEN